MSSIPAVMPQQKLNLNGSQWKALALWLREEQRKNREQYTRDGDEKHYHFYVTQYWQKFVALCQMGWRIQDSRDDLFFVTFQWTDTTDWLTRYKKMYLDWCRNSGKTEKAALLAVFQTVVMNNECIWFCKSTKQFMRVQNLWNRCPFVIFHKPSRIRTEIDLVLGLSITMTVLDKMENANGPHPRCGFYDEFADMEMALIQKTFGMYDNDPFLCFLSTPVADSPTTTIRTMYETRTHTYLDCPWKDPKSIEALKIPGFEDLWAQEYLCVEIPRQSCIFKNIIETSAFPTEFRAIYQGLDFGEASFHHMVRVGYSGGMCWALAEKVYRYKTDDKELQEDVLLYPTKADGGGWNAIKAPKLNGVQYIDVSGGHGQVKIDQVKAALACPLCIDPNVTPYLFKQTKITFFDGRGRVDTKPLHNVAALFLAVRPIAGNYPEAHETVRETKPLLPHHLQQQRNMRRY